MLFRDSHHLQTMEANRLSPFSQTAVSTAVEGEVSQGGVGCQTSRPHVDVGIRSDEDAALRVGGHRLRGDLTSCQK